MVCGWSSDGQYFAAGSKDFNVYLWHWNTGAFRHGNNGSQQQPQPMYTEVLEAETAPPAAITISEWTQPQPLHKLEGHQGIVMLLQFSKDGTMLLTGARDGTLRVGNTRVHHLSPSDCLHTMWTHCTSGRVATQPQPDAQAEGPPVRMPGCPAGHDS